MASQFERDYMMRLVKQLAEMMARLLRLKQAGKFAEASELLGDSFRALFGLDRRFLQMMPPPQVATVLGSPEKVLAFCRLMGEDADLSRVQGDTQSAAAASRWALRIFEEAKVSDEEIETRTLLARLRTMAALEP